MFQNVPTFIVDHSALIREGLVHILSDTKYSISGVCSDMDEIDAKDSDVLVLLGIDAEPSRDCAKIRAFKEHFPSAKVIVLSPACRPNDLLNALNAGADCLLSKQVSSDALLKALDLVMVGETILPRACLPLFAQRADEDIAEPVGGEEQAKLLFPAHARGEFQVEHVQKLSRKEREILRCLTEGASNKVIARELNMAEATVKVHIKGILRKIRAKNRTQAAVWALNCEGGRAAGNAM